MKTLILALSSLFVFINPEFEMKMKKEKPRILEASRFRTVGCTPDVLSQCVSERLLIVNPMLYTAILTINCGDDSDEADVTMYPRTKLTVEIELDIPGDPETPSCRITGWRKLL